MNILDKIARENGFADTAEMNEMVARLDLSDRDRMLKFKVWQYSDGTRAGLLRLVDGVVEKKTDEDNGQRPGD